MNNDNDNWVDADLGDAVFSRPGQSQGLLYKHCCDSLISSFIHLVCDPFPPLAQRSRHDLTVRVGAPSNKIDDVTQIYDILNLKGYQNSIIGSKVTAIWKMGGVASGRVCAHPAKQACSQTPTNH